MNIPAESGRTRFTQRVRNVLSRFTGHVSLACFALSSAMSTAMLRAGAVLLIAVPIAEIAVGVDLFTMIALIAPEAALVVAIGLGAVYFFRRARRERI